MQNEKETSFKRLQEIESERVKLRAENTIEIDDLRLRMNSEYSEKLRDIEVQNKALRDEIRKKEISLLELTNETMKMSNEANKRIALVEQERDFIKRDLIAIKEILQKREIEYTETGKALRGKDVKMK